MEDAGICPEFFSGDTINPANFLDKMLCLRYAKKKVEQGLLPVWAVSHIRLPDFGGWRLTSEKCRERARCESSFFLHRLRRLERKNEKNSFRKTINRGKVNRREGKRGAAGTVVSSQQA
jgi:hypothetical protein